MKQRRGTSKSNAGLGNMAAGFIRTAKGAAMKTFLCILTLFGLALLCSAESFAGPKFAAPGGAVGGSARGQIQRYWRPAVPVGPYGRFYYSPYYYYPYPYAFYGQNPRSVIVITPSAYSLDYYGYGPATLVTSEPFYCQMHHVGFVSRAGFLDHISGTHKIPLETAASICTENNESCVIEGY